MNKNTPMMNTKAIRPILDDEPRDPFEPLVAGGRPVFADAHDEAVTRVARLLLRKIPPEGITAGRLRKTVAGRDKHLVEDALRRLTYGQRIALVEGPNGRRCYVLVDGLAEVQGVELLHGVLAEVRRLEATVRELLDRAEGRPRP